MKKVIIQKKYYLLLFVFLISQVVLAKGRHWETIAPGMEYTKIVGQENNWLGSLHAFRFNLSDYQLGLIFAKDYERRHATVEYLAKQTNALIATNGGFFSPELKPLGLRIQNGVKRNELKGTSWWGIFYTIDSKAYISSQRQFQGRDNIDFAVQGGPRLIINGQIPSLKSGKADRTAIGITRDGRVILVVTDNFEMDTFELAAMMSASEKNGGLECINAINLDGGHSSQLYAAINDFFLQVTNLSAVTDAIIVKRR